MVKNYEEAVALLGERDALELPGKVTVRREGDRIVFQYEDVDFVAYAPRECRITTGRTMTTKFRNRLEEYAPLSIESDRGVWIATAKDAVFGVRLTGLFRDDLVVTFDRTGKVEHVANLGPIWMADAMRTNRNRAVGYARTLVEYFRWGYLNQPHQDMCALCCAAVRGVPLGEYLKDITHLQTHINHGQYLSSIVVRAVETAEEENRADLARVLRARFAVAGGNIPGGEDPVWRALGKEIRRYLFRQLAYTY